jgi:uncharacterized membrane protein (DUF373 family)
VSREQNQRNLLPTILNTAERIVYYVVVLVLLLSIGLIFFSVGASVLQIWQLGVLGTVLAILDRVLLIFIFVELLNTVEVTIREREIVAEPFLLIGLIAVVRRILLVTAQLERVVNPEELQTLLIELGVLTALVIVLSSAIYLIRRTQRFERET